MNAASVPVPAPGAATGLERGAPAVLVVLPAPWRDRAIPDHAP